MIRFLDSFDHYGSGDFGLKYSFKGGSNLSINTGRFGNAAQFFDDSSNRMWLVLNDDDEWIMGFALLPSQLNTTSFVYFRDINASVTHVDLGLDAGGRLSFRRNGTQLGVGTTVLNPLVWYYVEIKFTIHDTTGTATVRLDGVDEIGPLTGLDTRNGSSAVVNQFFWTGIGGIGTGLWLMDDLIIMDNVDSGVSGKPNNDFLGDIRVEATFPNGNGNTSDLDGSDGNSTDNYLLVDETGSPDEDTTYVQSTSVGEKDTYAFSNLSAVVAGAIYGLQIVQYARKTEAGTRTVATIARHSGTEEDGDDNGLSTSWQFFFDVREEKPGGGGWALSDVNAAEFGHKVTG